MRDYLTKRFVPLAATFLLSIGLASALQYYVNTERVPVDLETTKTSHAGSADDRGFGSSGPGDADRAEADLNPTAVSIRPLRITSTPKATYTDAARASGVEGSVRLKIVLLANGSVGNITTVTTLPDGLTEQAIAAARKIQFEPKMVNGVPISVVVTREYTFTIY